MNWFLWAITGAVIAVMLGGMAAGAVVGAAAWLVGKLLYRP